MIIHCPSCSARYPVDAASFAPSGRKVRCAKCGHSWHQSPPDGSADEMPPPPPDEELAAATITPIRKKIFGEKPSAPAEAATPDATPADAGEGAGDDDVVFADTETPAAAMSAATKTGKAADIGNRFRAEVARAATMRRGRMLSAAGWVALCLFLAGTLGGGWVWRNEVAAYWPATVPLYAAAGDEINLRGLELRNIAYERQIEDGLPVLAVTGEVVNVAGKRVVLPRLRVGLLDETQSELYHWTFALSEDALPPDETASFITRLSSPPPEARDIEIRFAQGTDLASVEPPEEYPDDVPDAPPAADTP